MSVGPNQSAVKSRALRHQFWSWSVAVASSLTTTAAVTVPISAVWAEDASVAEQSTDEASAATPKYDTAKLRALIQGGKLKEAIALWETAAESAPDDVNLWRDNLNLIAQQRTRSQGCTGTRPATTGQASLRRRGSRGTEGIAVTLLNQLSTAG